MLAGLNGCASWTTSTAEPAQLPTPPLAADSVVLEVAFVKVPDDWDEEGQFWGQVDEQHWAAEVRRQLGDNGLRPGLLGMQLPRVLHRALEETLDPLDHSRATSSPEENEVFGRQKRLRVSAGHSKRVNVTAGCPERVVVMFAEAGAIRAANFDKPRGLVNIGCKPLRDSRVELEVTPEIEYGAVRQRWTGTENMLVHFADRPRQALGQLRFTTTLSPGQTLLLTATPEVKGLGGFFFARPEAQQRSIMLIRLAQTHLDDLFSPAAPPPAAIGDVN